MKASGASATLGVNARMYSVTPASAAGWRALFAWLAQATGIPLAAINHAPPVPLAQLWARPRLGGVIMCGWPFAEACPRPHLLAAPIPAPARYSGRAEYWSDLVVHADSPHRSLEDTFGGSVGWTIEDSHSGFNMLRHHLLQHRSADRAQLFARSIGGLVNPLGALTAVAEGRVDVVPVDSFCHDLLRADDHPVMRLTRIIGQTAASPMPVLIASHDVDAGLAQELSSALLDAHNDRALVPHLAAMLVERFVKPDPSSYGRGRTLHEMACNAGYPIPA